MNLIIEKTSRLQGQISPPGSKSQSIRAIILATLCRGKSVLNNVLHSSDTEDAIMVCKKLGADISVNHQQMIIQSQGLPLSLEDNTIHTGNSGITTHFLMPLIGLRKNLNDFVILDCSAQMRARPITSLVNSLIDLGLKIDYLEDQNTLPLKISGSLTGGKTTVSGITSQYLSALLFALPFAKNESEIIVENLQERSYADMTLGWLNEQNIQYQHTRTDYKDIFTIPGNQSCKPFATLIAGDFSSASCLIAAAVLIAGEVMLQGINMADPQGDKQLIYLLQKMGADIEIHSSHLFIRGGKPLTGIRIDANDIPDLLPILAVIGTAAAGETEIFNVAHARIKETDRIHSMTDGLSRMGAKITERDDGMLIQQSELAGAKVKSYGDHRTVMALAIAGLIADGKTCIDNSEAINKTFPEFVQTLRSIGARMEMKNA